MTHQHASGEPRLALSRRRRIVIFIAAVFLMALYCLWHLSPIFRDLSETSGFPLIYRMAAGENLPGYAAGSGLVTARENLPAASGGGHDSRCAFTIKPREPALNNGRSLVIRDNCAASYPGEQREFIYPAQNPEEAAFVREEWGRHGGLLFGLFVYSGIILILSLWFLTEARSGFHNIGRNLWPGEKAQEEDVPPKL